MDPRQSTMPGLWKQPTFRETGRHLKWLEGRRLDDGAEGLWRIHDALYDFSRFVAVHPGGAQWLQFTKGTDITEAFEAHHISPMPRDIVKKFYVKKATTQRNSPYTFKEDGFYNKLRMRVYAVMPHASKRGPTFRSLLIMDSLAAAMFVTSMGSAMLHSVVLALLAGYLLALTTTAAHNFIHMKDNWRKNYLSLVLLSPKHWATIHVLSHHLYPNSLHDLEISMYEVWLQWMPYADKGLRRYLSWFLSPFVYTFTCLYEYVRTKFEHGPEKSDLIPLLVPVSMLIVTGFSSPLITLQLWIAQLMFGSLVFVAIGLNTGHHHPDIFHDGDVAREDRDWGLAQLDSVLERPSVSGVTSGGHVTMIDSSRADTWLHTWLSLTHFGHHTLHHLFPTVDHSRLSELYPLLERTMREFGETFQTRSATELVLGQFQQLARNKPNLVPPGPRRVPGA